MNPQYDPGMEWLNTGTLRFRFPRNYRKKTKKQHTARSGKYCPDCGKQGYATEEAAREVIGNVARFGKLIEAGSFAIHPYLCHHGWWHVGRNKRTLRLFKEFFEKRSGKVPHFPTSTADQKQGTTTTTGE